MVGKTFSITRHQRGTKCSICQNNFEFGYRYADEIGIPEVYDNPLMLVIQKMQICEKCIAHIAGLMLDEWTLGHLHFEKEKARQDSYPDRYKKKPIARGLKWAVMKRDGFKCLKCGSQDRLHADHVIPEIKGGNTELDNLQTLCCRCNSSKNTQEIDYRDKEKQ